MRVGLIYDGVYPFTLGGVEHRNVVLAQYFNSVTFYGFAYWVQQPQKMFAGYQYVSVGAARDLHAAGKRKLTDSLAAAWGTFWALLRSKDDVWDIANIAVLPVIAARMASVLKRKPLVVTWHEFFGDEWYAYLGPRLGWLAKRLERLALRCSPTAIAVSPQTRDRLLWAGYPHQCLQYIPNGIDIDAIDAAATVASADMICVGRLADHKRVDLAIRALQRIRAERPNATLAIIGDGPERANLEKLTHELNLDDAVTFHGFLPNDADVFARMKGSRVALLPSAREGFGLAAVQAWACGLPVVVCDDPENATKTLVSDPRLGVVTAATPECLAAACLKLLNNDDQTFRTAHARAHYSCERMAAAVRSVYESAIKGC